MPSIARDPLFTGDEPTLRALVDLYPGTPEAFFGDTLQGDSVVYRYAGLQLLSRHVGQTGSKTFSYEGALMVDEEEVFVYPGDLRVGGDLVIGDQSIVVVAGDLEVRGAFVGGAWDYSLLAVGGTMTVGDVMTQGELIVGRRLSASGGVYLHGNDHSAVTPRCQARVLVQNDRFDQMGAVEAEEHVCAFVGDDPELLARVGSLLGAGRPRDVDQLEAHLRSRLTAAVPV